MAQAFSNIGVDPILGAQIMEAIRANEEDLMDPKRVKKIQDIVRFFKNVENPENLIRRITSGKLENRLEHLWEWVELNKAQQEEMEKVGIDDSSEGAINAIGERLANKASSIKEKQEDLMDLMKAEASTRTAQQSVNKLQDINNKLKQYE